MPFSSRHIAFAHSRRSRTISSHCFDSRLPLRSRTLSVFCTLLLSIIGISAISLSTVCLSAMPSSAAIPLEIWAELELLEFDLALGFLSIFGESLPEERFSLAESFSTHSYTSGYTSGFAYLSRHQALLLKHTVNESSVDVQTVLQDTTSRPIPRRSARTSRTLNSQTPENTSVQDELLNTSTSLSTSASLSTNAALSTTAAFSTETAIRALAAQRLSLLGVPAVDVNALADSLGIRRGATDGAIIRKGTDAIPFSGQTYNFQAKFDSTQFSNALRMKLGDRLLGTEYRPEQTLQLDDYLNNRTEFMRRSAQDSILQHYDFRRPFKLELSSILGQANNFNVPFPQNPLTTIFGKPELRLNANFEINLRIGSMWNTSLGGQASTLGQVQWVPVFQPNVQANVDAKLGDKFNINLDMNTLRQFEFDNLTRLAYDGEPDEIFRRIEFGNVSLNSPSAFIGGSQALFGVRADFQFGPVYLKTVASTKRGQSRVATVKGGSVKQPIMLRAYDYADNHFFINLAHKTVVWPVFERGGFPLQATVNTQLYRVKSLEVWESTSDLRDIQAADVIAIDTLRPLSVANGDSLANGTPAYTIATKRRLYDSTSINAGFVEKGRFRLLRENERYTFDPNLGTLRILNLRRDRSYAVAYRLEGASQGDDDDIVYGTLQNTIDPNDSAKLSVLQLIYRPNMQPAFRNIWARQRQNVYFIGATNVSRDPKDTRINFWYLRQNNDSTDILPGAQDKLATVLGVDRVNNTSGAGTPDGLFDINLPYIFDAARGEITFTSLEPFRKGLIDYFTSKGNPDQANQFVFAAVYDTTRDAARLNAQFDRFVISGEVSGQASNRITLQNAFNLSPGSVKVRLNGALLAEFQDYRVEYYTGQVEILNPQALLPNANVEVEYEQNDAFNLATRNMLGLRLDLDTKSFLRSRDLKLDLGMTVVNYSQDNPAARIRLSEEPLSNTMLGIDGQATLNADWLTKALDWLPFYDTKAPSSFSIKGEAAWSLSNPNTRPSEIASDNNSPSVYIDDFEATQRIYALGVQPAQWRYASPPQNSGIPNLQSLSRLDSTQLFRGAMRWFAFNEGRVQPTQVYPNRAVAVGINGTPPLRPLEIDFNPFERGIYNTNPDFVDSITYRANPQTLGDTTEYKRRAADPVLRNTLFGFREKGKIWGGIMRTLSAFNLNFDNENMDFIEVVLKVDGGRTDPQTKMYIDVGQISEDVIPNGVLDTEDGILPGRETPNGRIAEGELGEDVGLDGLSNAQEKSDSSVSVLSSVPPLVRAKYRGLGNRPLYANENIRREEDPSRDDFRYDFRRFNSVLTNPLQRDSDFVAYNGLEGNSAFVDFQFPDTEVLNQNNGQVIARADDYFRYEVNLTPDRATNPQFVNNVNGWITLRIPLRGARTEVGKPLFTNIQYVRALWVGGRFKAQIIDWRFVGSQWIRQPVQIGSNARGAALLDSTTLSVGFVGREENSGAPFFYTMPPGVQPPVNRNNFLNPTQFGNEQSLLMQLNGLRQGDERSVARFFRPFDAFFYKQMKFFFHGGENLTYTPTRRSEAQAIGFIRFGVDTLNYYEYSVPLQPGWKEVAIDLPKLTALKPIVQLSGANAGLTIVPADDGMGEYRVKGSPTLTRIQFVSFGVRNPTAAPSELTTSVWVNELRLIQPDVTTDLMQNFAAVGTASAKIADLGTVNATLNMQTPYFTKLEERFGNRNDRQTLAVTGQFNFERFFPEDWSGTSLPLSVTYNQLQSTPRFLPQNDQNLAEVATNEAGRRLPGSNNTVRDSLTRAIINEQSTRTEDLQVAVTGARLNIPIYFFLFRDVLNRISVDYNYVRRIERSPVVELKTFEGWRFRMAYNHTLPPLPIKPFGWAENVPVLQWLSGWTIFAPVPNTITASVDANQGFQREISRIQPDVTIPNILNFEAARQLQLTYKMSDNELLNPTIDYSVNTVGTLVPFWLEPGSRDKPLPASEVQRNILTNLQNGNSVLNIGTDTRHGQNFRITFRPKFPEFMGGNKFFNLTGNYGVQYGWERLLRPTLSQSTGGASLTPQDALALNNGAGFQNTLNGTFALRLKEMGNALFPSLSSPTSVQQNTFQPSLQGTVVPPTQGADTSITAMIFRGIKSAVFDWDQFTVTYTQQGSATNPGVRGGTGFMTTPGGVGPSFEYQMGLETDPHASWFQPSNQFPFFEMRRVQGPRPVNVDLPDMSKIGRTIDIRAQREIIPGLQLELSWQTKNETTNNQIFTQLQDSPWFGGDTLGLFRVSNRIQLETFGRSFFLTPFNPIGEVERLYRERSQRVQDTGRAATRQRQAILNEAFVDGLEALNWWSGEPRFLLPNLNFAVRWNGLEQLPFFKGILRSGSLESKYQGRYAATRRVEASVQTLDQQSVQSSFEPLIGITAQFDDKFVEGILQGNMRLSTKTNLGIMQSQQGIIQSDNSVEFTLQATYQRRGMELPKIGGLSLLKLIGIDFEFTNDVEFGLQATYRSSLRQSINVLQNQQTSGSTDASRTQARRIDGTTNILFEPSMRYTISKQVSARVFFRYEANLSEGANAAGSTVTQFGVDLRLNLSGGRSF